MAYTWTPNDYQTLVTLSKQQNPPIDPVQVAAIMFEETGGSFSPAQLGPPGSDVSGLNQMKTANLPAGITKAQWTSMTPAQQLPIIFSFWRNAAAQANGGVFPSDAGELLALNFEPGAFQTIKAGSNPNAVLAGKNGPYASNYSANSLLDPGKTGTITVNTCRQYMQGLINNWQSNSRWQTIVAGIQQADGDQLTPNQAVAQLKSPLVTAIIGGIALGAAAHYLLPQVEREVKVIRRRRRKV